MRIDLFNGIPEEEVKHTLQNIHNNLVVFANHQINGHAFKKHVDKSDEYLQERLANTGLNASTAFYSASDAKMACLEALKAKWHVVERFLLSPMDDVVIIRYMMADNKSIGYGYKKGVEGVFEDLHAICIVLQKDDTLGYGFYIKTTYPMITSEMCPERWEEEK